MQVNQPDFVAFSCCSISNDFEKGAWIASFHRDASKQSGGVSSKQEKYGRK